MNEEAKKKALLLLPSCAAVIGTRGAGGEVAGATVTWMTQSSFKPPLIVAALRMGSAAELNARRERRFALSFLGPDQKSVGQTFFRAPTGADGRIADLAYETGRSGAPILADCAAWVECEVRDFVDGGDHAVVVAEVIEAGIRSESPRPLLLADVGWKYGG